MQIQLLEESVSVLSDYTLKRCLINSSRTKIAKTEQQSRKILPRFLKNQYTSVTSYSIWWANLENIKISWYNSNLCKVKWSVSGYIALNSKIIIWQIFTAKSITGNKNACGEENYKRNYTKSSIIDTFLAFIIKINA